MNLNLPFNKAITLWRDREALIEGSERLTYGRFGERVASCAAALLSYRLPKGSRVAVIAPNGIRFMECYYACALSGLVLLPVNIRLSAEEIASILVDAGVSLIFLHSDLSDKISLCLKNTTGVKDVIWLDRECKSGESPKGRFYETVLSENSSAELPDIAVVPDDLVHLYYTSGTTGKPKGVMLTQGNVTFHALAAAYELDLSDEDTWLHIAPMFHLADAWALFSVTWAGGRHVFVPYFKPEAVLKTMEDEKVTITAMVPTMVSSLLHHPNIARHSFKHLRLMLTAGSPIAPEVVRQIVSVFSCDYTQFYGMTETSPFLTISTPKAHLRHLPEDELLALKGKTGRSFLGVELKVVRDDGADVVANNKEVGEIVARGPSVTKGYWQQPDATAETIRGGWLHTGDLAVIDGEGYVNIVDRKKDMIITGGENVYSTEVEYVLHEHPAVLECAVFGRPDPEWGEAIVAVVVLKANHSADEKILIDFVKSKIAGYKAPRRVHFLPELPKTGSGKIFKRGLKEQFAVAK